MDKRLLERMQTGTQRVDINAICEHLPDISDKAEYIEVDHEPVCLLKQARYTKSQEKDPEPEAVEPQVLEDADEQA